jgi:DNA-binding transcriptional regulator YdaS (Cro superfamily)
MFKPIKKAIEEVGGLTALADLLDVKPPTVSQWKSGVRPVPVQFCKKIQAATNNKVTCKDLRPNDWKHIWPELKDAA